jgi:hypothetical protein
MKKVFIFVTILLSSSMAAYSQNRADTTVYIEPIIGGSASDRTFFEENLKMEATAAGYNIIDDLFDAIYSFSGSIAPEDDGNVLSITLSNVAESREMVTQELFYIQVEESYEVLPFLVWQMMANAPFLVSDTPSLPSSTASTVNNDILEATNSSRMAPIVNLINAVPDDDTWKNKWIYLGTKFGPSLHFYMASSDSVNNVDEDTFAVEAGMDTSVQVLDFLSVQIEVNFSMDNADYRDLKDVHGQISDYDHVYNAAYLYMPLLVKAVLKPGRIFLVEPYGGAYLNIDFGLGDMQLPVGGWLAGIDFGFKVGSGVLFFDLRYTTDFLDTTVTDDYDGLVQLRRHAATISAGYRIGFLNRKQSATRFRGARY